jgi:radical SAM protein with 4Fe4S-binding SPASM domain
MSDKLFEKIASECSTNRLSEIHLHNFGEPLLDKHLEDHIRLVKSKCKVFTKIFTNGSLLFPDRARSLLDSGIDEIKISIDGSTPEEFEMIRPPLKWSVVSSNVNNLIELRDSLKSRTKIYITCCTGKSASKLFNSPICFAFGPKHNWGGQTGANTTKSTACHRLWRTFTILVDGLVARCHADVHGEHCLGDINYLTIKEVWNSNAYNDIRDLHKQSQRHRLRLCCDCSQ